MELPINSTCTGCKWLSVKFTEVYCKAFPSGIPKSILTGETNHSKPLQSQKNDIVFEPIEKE